MAVPSSGELELRGDIALEVYGTATGSNISLGTMSDLAGFSDPDAMSDFYGYSSSVAPSVTTNNISNVSYTSVTLNGNVTSDGGATITERGFYFGTNSSSPTNNTKYTVSGTTGSYSNNRTGLSASTTYYCWAFATNASGTTYGSRVQATTIAAFSPTFAPGGTDAYAYISAQTYSSYQQTHILEKYYLNPMTGSYSNYGYESANRGSGTYREGFFYFNNYPNLLKVCTNAYNSVGASAQWPTEGQVDIYPNMTMLNNKLSGGPYNFSSRSYFSDFTNPQYNVPQNTSSGIRTQAYVSSFYTSSNGATLVHRFNYS